MAYAQLKTDIAAVIRNNGNQEITGNVLQGALLEMINALGANYQYAGVADTSTTITTTEANVFYLLTEAGTYSNMSSSIVHQSGIGIALWNGSAWSYQNVPSSAIVATDATPTANSTNPVQSGGVYAKLYGQEQNYISGQYIGAYAEIKTREGSCYEDEYIPVSPNDVVEWKFSNEQYAVYMAVYNSSKEYIEYYTGDTSSASSGVRTITLSNANSAYIRCSFVEAQLDNCYVKINGQIVWTAKHTITSLWDDIPKDETPTEDSTKAMTSGAIFNALSADQSIESEHTNIGWVTGSTTRIITDSGEITTTGATSNNRVMYIQRQMAKDTTIAVTCNNISASEKSIRVVMFNVLRPAVGTYCIQGTMQDFSVPVGTTTIKYKCAVDGFVVLGGNRLSWDGTANYWGAFSGEYYFEEDMKDAVERLAEESRGAEIIYADPKSEFLPKMMSAKKRYYTSSETDKPNPIVIAQLSDIHANWDNVSRFLQFCNEYQLYIDALLNTGDTVSSYFTDGITGYLAIDGVENILNVIGNHDTRGTSSWTEYAGTDVYNLLFAPFVSDWVSKYGIVQPTSPTGKCYYYKDWQANSLRMIVVDIMSYDSTQDTWLQGVLSDAITNDYEVLIATHFTGVSQPTTNPPMDKVDCNYSTLYPLPTNSTQSATYNANSYLLSQSVDAFMTNGGTFIGYLAGHFHEDMVAKVHDYPNQYIYGIGTSGAGEKKDYNHIEDTRFQDEFQIVSIDTYLHTIRLYKVGANIDLYGRDKNCICIDYLTKQIICDW